MAQMTREEVMNSLILCLAPEGSDWGDLSVYMRLMTDEGTAVVTADKLASIGISPEEAVAKAKENMRRDAVVVPLGQKLMELGAPMGDGGMMLITNKQGIFGAGTVLAEGLLDEVADRLHTDRLYILPSSVHELLAVDGRGYKEEDLNAIIGSVNATVVSDSDYLSGHAYFYKKG